MTKLEEVALSIWHERAKHFGEPPRPFVKDERTGREKNAIVPAGWIPICEKRFMYDMTLSLTLAPETKGKPRFDLTHKITDDHIPFFPEGQFIGRRAGELLRLWATGADIPPDMLATTTGQQPASKPGKAEQAAKTLIDAANNAVDETELRMLLTAIANGETVNG